MSKFRNVLAYSFRALPPFRGKGPLGVAIGRLMTDYQDAEDCVVTVKMQDGSLMRVDVRSRSEQWAYWTGAYDQAVISRLATCLQTQCVVLDVGANVGFYSISLGNRLRGMQGELHAFEPIKSNCDRLVECVRLNRLEDVVTPHNVALGDEEGIVNLWMEDSHNASTGNAVIVKGKVIDEDKLTGNSTARITRLDSYAEEKQINACHLIKIDVEGAEVMFLRGGSAFLAKHRPIIYGEFNRHWLKQFGHSFVDVANIVHPWHYRFFQEGKRGQFVEVKNPGVGLQDVLLCPLETPDSTLAALGVTM